MKKVTVWLLSSLLFVAMPSHARDDVGDYSLREALSLAHAKEKLGSDVRFYFGNQRHGKVVNRFGERRTNKKTNAFNKTDLEACQWVFLSAMIELKKQALNAGANAVVNIKSNYKNNLTSSNKTFQCGAGTFIAGVALTGDIVTLK